MLPYLQREISVTLFTFPFWKCQHPPWYDAIGVEKQYLLIKRKLWQAVTLLFLQPFPSEPSITRFDIGTFELC